VIDTGKGTVPKKSHFACGRAALCRMFNSIKATKTTGPVAGYVIRILPKCDGDGQPYDGRFFDALPDSSSFFVAHHEWETRKNADLAGYWPLASCRTAS